MRKINYSEILLNIPFGDEIDFLESEMKIAEHDYFCKPQTFIKGLRQAINELKIEIISNAEKERERINNDIKNPGSWEFMYLYERGLSFADATDEQKQKSKEYNKQRSDKYIKERLADLEKVNSDTINQIAVLDSWQSKVDELERIHLKAESNLLSLTRSLSPAKQRFLYGQLVEKGFIDKSEDYQNFCFAFGGSPLNREFKKIKWCVKNRQCLRDLLSEIKFHKTDADMLKTVGYYFVDWKGQTMRLPVNNKHDPFSPTEGLMKEILIEFRKL